MTASINPPSFLLESGMAPSELNVRKSDFLKERTKIFCISQKNKPLIKFHSHILEGDFDSTLDLFDHPELNLPDQINSDFLKTMVNYLYFHQVDPPVEITKIFDFLQLAYFLKLNDLSIKIKKFLSDNITALENANFIRKGAYKFDEMFKEKGKEFIFEIIDKCESFLIKNKDFEGFFSFFDEKYFAENSDSIEEMFLHKLELFKKNETSADIFLKLIVAFKQAIVSYFQKKDNKFAVGNYFRKIMQENVNFNKLDIIELQLCLENLNDGDGIKHNFVMENMVSLQTENRKLTQKIENMKKKLESATAETTNYKEMLLILNQKLEKTNEIIKNNNINHSNELTALKEEVRVSEKKRKCQVQNELQEFLLKNFPEISKNKFIIDSERDSSTPREKKNIMEEAAKEEDNREFKAKYSENYHKTSCEKEFPNKNQKTNAKEIKETRKSQILSEIQSDNKLNSDEKQAFQIELDEEQEELENQKSENETSEAEIVTYKFEWHQFFKFDLKLTNNLFY